jgi:hypothetical protein
MKERLDFSCALFTSDGGLVANAPHIPVHLGAMQSAVKFQTEYWNSEGREGIQEGDVRSKIILCGLLSDMMTHLFIHFTILRFLCRTILSWPEDRIFLISQ